MTMQLTPPDQTEPARDQRTTIYADLQQGQLSAQEQQNRHSAQVILGILKRYIEPTSVLDVGCGLGTWMDVAQKMFGTNDIAGIEGHWTKTASITPPRHTVHIRDLENGFDLNRRYDVAICLEVGEHLSPAAGPKLIESLVRHSDTVLFSAAIPGQGGHHHVNEKFLSYWAGLFEQHKFVPVDLIRRHIWHDQAILWWLRQNIIVFTSTVTPLMQHDNRGPVDIVHPDVYISRLLQMQHENRMLRDQINGTITMGA